MRIFLFIYSSLMIIFVAFPLTSLSKTDEIGLKPHKPIRIVLDRDLTGEDAEDGCRCVTGGSGTPEDPYVIEGWDIDGAERDGISIENVSNILIRNIKVHNQNDPRYRGIYLRNVRNVRIEKTVVTKNKGPGIMIDDSSDNTLLNNSIVDNVRVGLAVYGSGNNTFADNKISGNNVGVELRGGAFGYFNTLIGNYIEDNGKYGIILGGIFNSLINNTISGNGVSGVMVNASFNGNLIRNTLKGNKDYGLDLYMAKSFVIDGNVIRENGVGIDLEESTDNLFINNMVIQNENAYKARGKLTGNRFINNKIGENKGDGKKEKAPQGPG